MKKEELNLEKGIDVFDITVKNAHHYILGNGVISHNCGGKYPKLASWMIFYLSKSLKKEDKNIVGQLINVQNRKNRSVPPFQKAVIDLDYRKGINYYAGMADLALNLGIFGKDGNYYVVNDKKMYGIQIMKKSKEIFTDELMNEMNQKLQEIGYYSIDKELNEIMNEVGEELESK